MHVGRLEMHQWSEAAQEKQAVAQTLKSELTTDHGRRECQSRLHGREVPRSREDLMEER